MKLSKIMTVAAEKGGVGKTTVSIHTAHALKASGQSVLVIDTCPQANMSKVLGVQADANESAAALYSGVVVTPVTSESGIDVVPASRALEFVEQAPAADAIASFQRAVRTLAEHYDWVIIDTPPSIGTRLRGALAAAHSVISPMECATFSLDGLNILLDTIAEVREQYNPELRHDAIIANKFRGTQAHRAIHAAMLAAAETTLTTPLHLYAAIEQTAASGLPVWGSASTGAERKASQNMQAIIFEIIKKVQL